MTPERLTIDPPLIRWSATLDPSWTVTAQTWPGDVGTSYWFDRIRLDGTSIRHGYYNEDHAVQPGAVTELMTTTGRRLMSYG